MQLIVPRGVEWLMISVATHFGRWEGDGHIRSHWEAPYATGRQLDLVGPFGLDADLRRVLRGQLDRACRVRCRRRI